MKWRVVVVKPHRRFGCVLVVVGAIDQQHHWCGCCVVGPQTTRPVGDPSKEQQAPQHPACGVERCDVLWRATSAPTQQCVFMVPRRHHHNTHAMLPQPPTVCCFHFFVDNKAWGFVPHPFPSSTTTTTPRLVALTNTPRRTRNTGIKQHT